MFSCFCFSDSSFWLSTMYSNSFWQSVVRHTCTCDWISAVLIRIFLSGRIRWFRDSFLCSDYWGCQGCSKDSTSSASLMSWFVLPQRYFNESIRHPVWIKGVYNCLKRCSITIFLIREQFFKSRDWMRILSLRWTSADLWLTSTSLRSDPARSRSPWIFILSGSVFRFLCTLGRLAVFYSFFEFFRLILLLLLTAFLSSDFLIFS